ncbi:MAG: hypothetical protein KC418_17830 [Anaerolineales bacterium]|nr:hypothetical protein [Anaerolineales bacterium]MCB8951524.1 hypothetical protein [Ardenticatenales bacterium]
MNNQELTHYQRYRGYLFVTQYSCKVFADLARLLWRARRGEPSRPGEALGESGPGASPEIMPPLRAEDFRQVNEAGFGERWNTWLWSMVWWKGRLYAGTNRAYPCVEYFNVHTVVPRFQRYPPRLDPDLAVGDCTPSPYDLPLQAEIWCYAPAAHQWQRIFQSPRSVPLPHLPGKTIARDLGFRNMLLYTEPDGTEALYVAGVSTRAVDALLPPPRLLRSTDGRQFTEVPCRPGTVLGDISGVSYRTMTRYKDRFYVIAGVLYGDGVLLEADHPALGNNAFRQVSPPGMRIFEMVPFNGWLYLGLRDPLHGYSVVKTKAEGAPPYRFETVIPPGCFRHITRSGSVVCMAVFRDALYVGTDAPAELLRIFPDDEWELICGRARGTPRGRKAPISGLGDGLGYPLNRVFQRMQVHNGWLYLAAVNFSTKFRRLSRLGRFFDERAGFGLYATQDGVHFLPVTVDGLGDSCNYNARTLTPTPFGMFLGAINEYEGAKVYLGDG